MLMLIKKIKITINKSLKTKAFLEFIHVDQVDKNKLIKNESLLITNSSDN